MGTILSIEICKVCEITPPNTIIIAAEILLKLKLNCYQLNEFMQIFLESNPFMSNEKMEIEQWKQKGQIYSDLVNSIIFYQNIYYQKYQQNKINHSFDAYFCRVANVYATRIGNTNVAYEYTFEYLAFNLSLPHVKA